MQISWDNLSKEVIEDNFITYYELPRIEITDDKFLKILQVCWKNYIDMNFDNSPDSEDLELIRNSDFKYYVLSSLCECNIYNAIHKDIKEILGD